MQQLRFFRSIGLALWIGLVAAVSSAAANTPEDAIAAYIEGVTEQDFDAIIAATAIENMTKGFDFVAEVGRIRALVPETPAPASSSLFKEFNKIGLVSRIAAQVKFLTYGLMTTSEILNGKADMMEAAGASEFANAVRADRLAGLALVKVGIPQPAMLNSERYQANAMKNAKVYGADARTERVALISFEGLHFVVAFTLLRYGDDWGIQDQTSAIAGFTGWGIPQKVTPDEFEDMLK